MATTLQCTAHRDVSAALFSLWGNLQGDLSPWARPAHRNFSFFAKYSTARTELFWITAATSEGVVGLAPVVRLSKRPATAMLRPQVRRWLGWLGPFAKKTTFLVDTAFLAYDDRSPFMCAPGVDATRVKEAIVSHLQSQRGVDAVWVTEPEASAQWLSSVGFQQFSTLPLAQVATGAFDSFEAYLASLSKKRRRNYRFEQDQFANAGAGIQLYEGPLEQHPRAVAQMLACLSASASHSLLEVPYNDVLTDPVAFQRQDQFALTAEIGGQVIGFMSFLVDEGRMLQCHGGLDYGLSHKALAYHNLIHAAIQEAIARRCTLLSMGPLNNETKRRAASDLRPMVASLWNRNPIDRHLAASFFARNFDVYRGEWNPCVAAR